MAFRGEASAVSVADIQIANAETAAAPTQTGIAPADAFRCVSHSASWQLWPLSMCCCICRA